MANSTQLKSEALMEQMKLHMSTDAGKKLVEKIGLVYQINIAPKVLFLLNHYSIICVDIYEILVIMYCVFRNWQKIGFNEKSFVVDLKKGEVKDG